MQIYHYLLTFIQTTSSVDPPGQHSLSTYLVPGSVQSALLCTCYRILSLTTTVWHKYCCNPPSYKLTPVFRLLPNLKLCHQLLSELRGLTLNCFLVFYPRISTKHLKLEMAPTIFPLFQPCFYFFPPPVQLEDIFLLASVHSTQAPSFLMSNQLPKPVLLSLCFPQVFLFPHFLTDFSSDLLLLIWIILIDFWRIVLTYIFFSVGSSHLPLFYRSASISVYLYICTGASFPQT